MFTNQRHSGTNLTYYFKVRKYMRLIIMLIKLNLAEHDEL